MVINQYCTCDVDNFGDVLYPILFQHVASRFLDGVETQSYAFIPGQAALDGGYEVRSIKELFKNNGQRCPLVIGGGDILRFDDRVVASHYSDYSLKIADSNYAQANVQRSGSYEIAYRLSGLTVKSSATEWFLENRMPPVKGAFILSPKNCPGAEAVAFFSAGVPSRFKREEWPHIQGVFGDASFIYLRDEQSAGKLIEAGVEKDIEVAPDVAVIVSDIFPKTELTKEAQRLLSAIHLSADRPYLCFQLSMASKPYLQDIARQLYEFSTRHDVPIVLLPLGFCHGDKEILSEISRLFPDQLKLVNVQSVKEMLGIISHASAFAGVSMHGNICAFSYRVPHLFCPLDVSKIGGALASLGLEQSQSIQSWSQLSQGLEGLLALDRPLLRKKHLEARRHAYSASERMINALAKRKQAIDPDERYVLSRAKSKAVELHSRGELHRALYRYTKILRHFEKDFDALHMLGVVYAQLGDPKKALRYFLKAAAEDSEGTTELYNNLGRAIHFAAQESGVMERLICDKSAGTDRAHLVFPEELPPLQDRLPIVSVVIPCYNHEQYVVEALRSVYAQDYPNIEMIVIDDGSRDRSVEMIRGIMDESPYPIRLVTRENRGADVTINEAIKLATGTYVAVLNSDDRYTSHRIDRLVRLLENTEKEWAFSRVKIIDEEGRGIPSGQDEEVDHLMQYPKFLLRADSITIQFIRTNLAISTGNLFFRKSLWETIGGFSNYKYVHDWEFCLRALEQGSPVILNEEAYDYRWHRSNTIKESKKRSRPETEEMLLRWAKRIVHGASTVSSRGQVLQCAAELVILPRGNGYLLGRQRLIGLAKGLV